MPTPLVKPATIVEPFAVNGQKNTIPVATNATPGGASFNDGFPALTMTPVSQGGIPPSGKDFNGILNAITQHLAWVNGGGQYTFDATLSAFTGGYPVGAVLQSDDGTSSYINAQANNTTNFNMTPASIGVSWLPFGGAAVSSQGTTSVATTGGTTTLTNAQAARKIINVTGALTSNAVVVFPAIVRDWFVINTTTGAYTLTVKTASDAGVQILQSVGEPVISTGYGMWYAQSETVTQASNDNSRKLASTAFVQTAVANFGANSVPQYMNANFAAGVTGDYWTDTSAGSFTMTLPDPPVGANPVRIMDMTGYWNTYPLIINAGTKTILGDSSPLICNVSGEGIEMFYNGSDWRIR